MQSSRLDASAVCLSGLCLVHCLALPLIASVLPIFSALAAVEWVHVVFVAAAAPIAMLALRRSGPALIMLGLAGVTLLACGAFGWPEHAWEQPLTVAGGLVLAATHILNWRRRAGALRAQRAAANG